MLYVVLATFAAGMATEYFLGNRWIGFFAVGVPACLYFFYLDYQKRAAAKKEEEEKRAKRKERKQQHKWIKRTHWIMRSFYLSLLLLNIIRSAFSVARQEPSSLLPSSSVPW